MRASPIRTPQFKGHFHIAVSTREVFVGTFGYGAAEIVRALDDELEPVVPPPVVLVEQ